MVEKMMYDQKQKEVRKWPGLMLAYTLAIILLSLLDGPPHFRRTEETRCPQEVSYVFAIACMQEVYTHGLPSIHMLVSPSEGISIGASCTSAQTVVQGSISYIPGAGSYIGIVAHH